VITGNYNSYVVRHAKAEPLLRPFKGSGRIRERGSDAWFPVEFLTYHDDRNRLCSFFTCAGKTVARYLTATMFFWMNLANGVSD